MPQPNGDATWFMPWLHAMPPPPPPALQVRDATFAIGALVAAMLVALLLLLLLCKARSRKLMELLPLASEATMHGHDQRAESQCTPAVSTQPAAKTTLACADGLRTSAWQRCSATETFQSPPWTHAPTSWSMSRLSRLIAPDESHYHPSRYSPLVDRPTRQVVSGGSTWFARGRRLELDADGSPLTPSGHRSDALSAVRRGGIGTRSSGVAWDRAPPRTFAHGIDVHNQSHAVRDERAPDRTPLWQRLPSPSPPQRIDHPPGSRGSRAPTSPRARRAEALKAQRLAGMQDLMEAVAATRQMRALSHEAALGADSALDAMDRSGLHTPQHHWPSATPRQTPAGQSGEACGEVAAGARCRSAFGDAERIAQQVPTCRVAYEQQPESIQGERWLPLTARVGTALPAGARHVRLGREDCGALSLRDHTILSGYRTPDSVSLAPSEIEEAMPWLSFATLAALPGAKPAGRRSPPPPLP